VTGGMGHPGRLTGPGSSRKPSGSVPALRLIFRSTDLIQRQFTRIAAPAPEPP
jgi:hypothetical protein